MVHIGDDPRYGAANSFAVAGGDLRQVCDRLRAWRDGALGLPEFEYDGQRNWSGEWSWGEARGPTFGVNVTQVHWVGDSAEWAFLTGALPGATIDVSVFWAAGGAGPAAELERALPSLLECRVARRPRRGGRAEPAAAPDPAT